MLKFFCIFPLIFSFNFLNLKVHAESYDIAVLRGLDKVTARISTFEAQKNKHIRFGTLRILVRYCDKRPPEETPETSVFLEVIDLRTGGKPRRVFTGWMFASSPAISALEHPTYDVWVIDCKILSTSSEETGGE
ncbi:MAG: glycosyl hydrolase family 5 [Rhodospirillaceae bacterium]|nr:glycosyl hydrolase family 5 [Rhodospirillaceae bacterium]